MRAHEIFEEAYYFYLGSAFPLSGRVTRVDLKAEIHPRHHGVETLLEQERPSHCLSRSACVLLADSPANVKAMGMPTNRIYACTPIGTIQRSDLRWWHLIRKSLSDNPSEQQLLAEWVAQYWTGNECPVGKPIWEFRAEAAEIKRRA